MIEYGGGNGWGNLWSYTCEASVTDTTLRGSSAYGLYRHFTTMTLTNITYSGDALGDL